MSEECPNSTRHTIFGLHGFSQLHSLNFHLWFQHEIYSIDQFLQTKLINWNRCRS
uniref:Uncharacterized protein n=1 Tax=Arundo donax TaxID=35708 RepID=A0A0A9ETB6_ARUDO